MSNAKALYEQAKSLDVRELNILISNLRNLRDFKAKMNWSVGDVVQFDGKTRGWVVGVIESIGPKNCKVRQSNSSVSLLWTVSPSLLKPVEASDATAAKNPVLTKATQPLISAGQKAALSKRRNALIQKYIAQGMDPETAAEAAFEAMAS